MRRARLVQSILLVLVALALGAVPGMAQLPDCTTPGGGGITVTGRVVDASGAPVPCCLVEVRLEDASGAVFQRETTRTRGDGTFETCLACTTRGTLFIVAESLCCDGTSEPVDVTDCTDPDTGDPLERVDVGDVTCADEPLTLQTLLEGSVACRGGVFLEPVADCSVLLSAAPGAPLDVDITDGEGRWEHCVSCDMNGDGEPDPTPATYLVEAQCCDELDDVTVSDCPERQSVPTLVCDDCPVPPCPVPSDVEIRGRVTCGDPAAPEPVVDCPVQVTLGGCPPFFETHDVVTAADGTWSLCRPCPAERGCVEWTVQTEVGCCPTGKTTTTVGCEPVVDLGDDHCDVASCPPSSCAAGEKTVRGRLTCVDPVTGAREPVVGCGVTVEGVGCVDAIDPVTVVTGTDGGYEACLPCDAGCTFVEVRADCCDAFGEAPFGDCATPEVVIDPTCSDCTGLTGPCPSGEVLARGTVACVGPAPPGTPLAGCEVELTPIDATGMPLPPVTALSRGDGSYDACLSCDPTDPAGLSSVEAVASCCGVTSSTPVSSCSEPIDLAALECPECTPCPDGMTRLQGRVRCRGGGPVAGCTVTATVPTCDGVETITATTDAQGKYRLCVPCPCDGETVRVTSSCCPGTRSIVVDECNPITPVPTLFCPSPCP